MSPRTVLDVKAPDGPRWDLALELLERGQGAVGLGGLTLRTDPATPKTGRLFHIEFPCPADPALSMESRREQLHALGNHDLENARRLIESLASRTTASRRWWRSQAWSTNSFTTTGWALSWWLQLAVLARSTGSRISRFLPLSRRSGVGYPDSRSPSDAQRTQLP